MKKKRLLYSLTLALFAAVSLLGILYCSSTIMDMSSSAADSVCASSMHHHGGCGMDTNAHIATWQKLLAATVVTALLGLILLLAWVVVRIYSHQDFEQSYQTTFLEQHQRYKLHNYFIELFASGIIQPKLLA